MQSRNSYEAHILVVTIAREGSFIRASRKLGIAQPSLTRRVALLEKNLGTKLFHRTSRYVELTRAGRLFVMESTISIEHADRAWDLARYQSQIENGPFRIGYSPYIHSAFLPLLHELSGPKGESTGIVLEAASTLELADRVLRGRLHAAVGVRPIRDDDLWVEPVGEEGFSLGIPRKHTLAQRTVVTVNDLDGEMVFWVPRSLHPQFYGRVMKYIRSFGVRPVFKEVWTETHALTFAAHGFGLALLPRSSARISRDEVTFRQISDRYFCIESALFMRQDQRYGPAKDFVDDLSKRLQKIKRRIN